MDIHQTHAYAAYLTSIGWQVESKQSHNTTCFAFVRKFPVVPFSILKLQRIPFNLIDWDWVAWIEQKHKVVETVVELTADDNDVVFPCGYRRAPDFMLNTKTLVIDLHQEEKELLGRMKPKTRYNIHLAGRHGLTPTIWTTNEVINDPVLFDSVYNLLSFNAKRIGMWLIPKQWIHSQYLAFGNSGFVVGIYKGTEMVSVGTFYCSETDCSYNLNGSTLMGRKLMAPTLAVWEGIRHAQDLGLMRFDFDGLYDERYPKQQRRFKGYGRFKEGFGGSTLYFPPMYRKMRWPISGIDNTVLNR